MQYLANAATCWGVRSGNNGGWDCRLWRWSKCDGSIDVDDSDPIDTHYGGRALITPGIGATLPGSRVGLHRDAVSLSALAGNFGFAKCSCSSPWCELVWVGHCWLLSVVPHGALYRDLSGLFRKLRWRGDDDSHRWS